ncbi:unnamed protein product [Rotaria sordida]|uniref:C2 domain-containing protein n=1 Tax=Rotaria sordida TaxID=392033 RepID=A0A813ZXF6_9BILA|nr:unnamed protein product [Rotaria sordida]CAF0989953.1 unnamed protein product [Rotaria sordida]
MSAIILSLIVGSITLLSSIVIVLIVYLQKKFKRTCIWKSTTSRQSVISSAPISRQQSSSCLFNLEQQQQQQLSRSRSASFGEDLTARLQTLAAGNCYRSYAPATIDLSSRSTRLSLGANIRFPTVSNTSPIIPSKPITPSITYQLRYEHTIETLFITIVQLNNYIPTKNTQNIYVILYLLPNDDEQRQTKSSINGIFNENFLFPLKSNDLLKRTLRLTAYEVNSITRIRHIIGHVFIKFDQFIDENKNDKTFSTNSLLEYLSQDLHIRSDYLGQLTIKTYYLKDQNLIQIRIQQINYLHIERSKFKTPLKAYFSGQLSNTSHKYHWANTSSFMIPSSSSSFQIDKELQLIVDSLLISTNDNHVECHLRLHLHGSNQIHSHARWKHSLQSTVPHTYTVSLVAL